VSLKTHSKEIHEGQRNYKCDSCGKYFTISGKLKKIPFTEIFTSKQIMDYLTMIWNSNWRKNLFGTLRIHLNRQNLVFQFHEKNQTKQRRYKSIEKHQQENIKSSTSKKKVVNKQLTEFLQTKIAQWCHNRPLLKFFKNSATKCHNPNMLPGLISSRRKNPFKNEFEKKNHA